MHLKVPVMISRGARLQQSRSQRLKGGTSHIGPCRWGRNFLRWRYWGEGKRKWREKDVFGNPDGIGWVFKTHAGHRTGPIWLEPRTEQDADLTLGSETFPITRGALRGNLKGEKETVSMGPSPCLHQQKGSTYDMLGSQVSFYIIDDILENNLNPIGKQNVREEPRSVGWLNLTVPNRVWASFCSIDPWSHWIIFRGDTK